MPGPTHLDLDLLRAFVAVAETHSFTQAARLVLRNQSAVSLQIKRLEKQVGRRLFERTPHHVRLTPQGTALLDDARSLLRLNDEILARNAAPEISGTVRLGTPEDFATAHLPQVLARFAAAFPAVTLEVTCDLTLNLLAKFRQRAFDLVLVKRDPDARTNPSGIRVWREPLVWVSARSESGSGDGVLPLVVSPPPCVYRKRAIAALDAHKRRWRVAYSCASLSGSLAAVRAGLGVTILPKEMVPPGLHVIDGAGALPPLEETEIALMSAARLSPPGERLRNHIIRSLEGEG